MLTIHAGHLAQFRAEALLDFEDRMLDHLRDFAPRHFRVLDDDDVRAAIRHGMDRAATHRVITERGIRYYVDVMFMLGSGFDADPLLPWAAEILAGPDVETVRADRLYARAWDHAGSVLQDHRALDGTVDRGRFVEELRRLRSEPDAPLPDGAPADLRRRTLERLAALFPRKAGIAREGAVSALFDRAVARARASGIGTERGVVVLAAMMFVLGAGCADDPLLPWLSATLRDEALADPTEKVDRLYAGAVACLRQWWAAS